MFKNNSKPPICHSRWTAIASVATEATDSISLAERILENEGNVESAIDARIQHEKSSLAKRSAEIRHEPGNRIKDAFVRYLDKSDYSTKKQAASAYYDELTEDQRLTFCPSRDPANGIRTLLDHYRNSKKNN